MQDDGWTIKISPPSLATVRGLKYLMSEVIIAYDK